MFGTFRGDEGEFAFDGQAYLAHLKEHFDSGEMTIEQALEAASMISAGHSLDITIPWQCALIALGEEDLAQHFHRVHLVTSKAGIGVTITINRDALWEPRDVTDEQKHLMDVATVACMKRHGIEAHFHEDGTMHIPQPRDDQDEIISSFLKELEDLPEQDPDKRGWDKWTK